MKRIASLCALVLIACSGGGGRYIPPYDMTMNNSFDMPKSKDLGGCSGTLGMPCCNGSCSNGLVCTNGFCAVAMSCGGTNQPCCNGTQCNNFGDACVNGTCTPSVMCGAQNQPCCNGVTCNNGLTCQAGTCSPPVIGNAPTGDPCVKPTDCGGTMPSCITKDAKGNTWPGGYCISKCNGNQNDPNTGLNPGCPGGNGTCLGGVAGVCETACTAKTGAMPCLRQGYSCFGACEPTSLSMCNPTLKGQCGFNMSCVRIGADDVGQCAPSCSPFAQGCAQIMAMVTGCYGSDDNGEGVCSAEYGVNQGDGVQCIYLNNCDPGLGCYAAPMAAMAFCRPYCGGPNNVACFNGKLCVDLVPIKVPKAIVGVCAG